jgi:RNA polymerase sigma-70 factor (ECF subfamily)
VRLHVRAQADDREALSLLFERHRARAYRVAMAVLRSPEDAEDAVQNALLSLLRYEPRVRTDGSVGGLVSQMALRSAQHLAESGERRRARDAAWAAPLSPYVEGPHAEVERRDTHQRLRAAVAGLHDRYRLPLELHYWQGLSTRETAEALGIDRSHLYRRMKALGISDKRPGTGVPPDT